MIKTVKCYSRQGQAPKMTEGQIPRQINKQTDFYTQIRQAGIKKKVPGQINRQ